MLSFISTEWVALTSLCRHGREAGGWPPRDVLNAARIGKELDILIIAFAVADASLAPNNGSQPC